jgi:hypothetical protein
MILAKHFFTLMSAPTWASGALQKRSLASTLMLGMTLAQMGFAAIPLEDDTPTVQAKHSTPLPSPRLYFTDQGKKLLIIGTQFCPGPTNPQITGIQAEIKTFQPTVALVDESTWPAVRLQNAGNTPLRRYPALPKDHDFIQQIVNRLHKSERVLVITSASRLRAVQPLLEQALAENAPPPSQALGQIAPITPTHHQFICLPVPGWRFTTHEAA